MVMSPLCPSSPSGFWYYSGTVWFRKIVGSALVWKMPKNGEKPAFLQRKSPETFRFRDFLVEISGIEPLTS